MSLSAALRTAQSSLLATANQTAISSRNIAGANNPGYSRKIALVSTGGDGAPVVTTGRAADAALLMKMLAATSSAASGQSLATSLDALAETIGDPQDDHSPAAQLSALMNKIQQYAASPSDSALAQSVVSQAGALASTLNSATDAVQKVRGDADAGIAQSVQTVNNLLAQFQSLNAAIVNGTRAGTDVTDQLDQRDGVLAKLSEEMGITTVSRGDNDLAIYTDSGVTLFETTARKVTFQPTAAYDAGTTGNAVMVDGVPVTGDGAVMPAKSGRIEGLTTVRDKITVQYQNQLDETARGLIDAFKESDQSATPTLPDAPGLFTYSGAPAMPGTSLVKGLAGDIKVNANVDPSQGGNLQLLRDGGIADPSNPAYRYNKASAASYSDRINAYIDNLSASRSYDPAAGLGSTGSLETFTASSASWLEGGRSDAQTGADYQSTLLQRSSDALSNATGVNLDDEMSLMLDLERSYQSSSKLIGAIDNMFNSLLTAVG